MEILHYRKATWGVDCGGGRGVGCGGGRRKCVMDCNGVRRLYDVLSIIYILADLGL